MRTTVDTRTKLLPHQVSARLPEEHMNMLNKLLRHPEVGLFITEFIANMQNGNPYPLTEERLKYCKKMLAAHPVASVALFASTLEIRITDYTKLFLEAGIDVNCEVTVEITTKPYTKSNQSALMRAIACDNLEVTELLLAHDAKIDKAFKNAPSALTIAAFNGSLKIIAAILKKYPIKDAENIGYPALIAVIDADHLPKETVLAVANCLLENGADVNIEFFDENLNGSINPLLAAIRTKNEAMIDLLIKYKIDAKNIMSRLEMAALIELDQFSLFEKIFSYCHDMEFNAASDNHPFYCLREKATKNKWIGLLFRLNIMKAGDLPSLTLRMEMIESVQLKDLTSLYTKLTQNTHDLQHVSEELRYKFCLDLIQHCKNEQIKSASKLLSFLLTFNGQARRPTGNPFSLFNMAIAHSNMHAFNALIQYDYPVEETSTSITTKNGPTTLFPVHVATILSPIKEFQTIIPTLVKRGANINAVCSPTSKTPLSFAISKDASFVECLLANGADVNLRNAASESLLRQAILSNVYTPNIRLIINHLNLEVDNYLDEMKLALQHNRLDVITFFVWRYSKQKLVPASGIKIEEKYAVIIHHLINMGIPLSEQRSLLKEYFSIDSSTRLSDSFVINLYTCLLNHLEKKSDTAIAITLLSELNNILVSGEKDSHKKLFDCLKKFRLKSPPSSAVETPLSKISITLIQHYINHIDWLCDQLLKDNNLTSALQDKITQTIILMNKKTSLITYLGNVFSIKSENMPPFNINATLYLMHEKRIAIRKALSSKQSKVPQDNAEENWQELEKERLILLEAQKQREIKKEARRNKQSENDRKKYEENNGHVLMGEKKRTRYRTYMSSPYKFVKTVSLSEPIKQAFALLDVVQGEKYIVGSAVIELLYPERKTSQETDIDMTASALPTADVSKAGFFKNRHIPNLFNCKASGIKVDLLTSATEDKSWRRADHRKRDFTICTLLCDEQGNIYDPTGRGLSDLENNILSTGKKNSYKCLSEDPVRILRAIKYLLRGYRADDSLVSALKSEYTHLDKHKEHLYAYARHYLRNDNARGFIQLLSHYKLLSQLFNVESCSDLNKMAQDLWGELAEKPVATPSGP